MNLEKLKSRNTALDILRIVAVFSVLSVHFLLHGGFYSETVTGPAMYIASMMRTLFTVCVPLFMTLTGYLMSKKNLSKKYYSGITKTIVVFVIISIICIIYKEITHFESLNVPLTDFKYMLVSILDFTGANYSWYIEMYIGLFLMAPFLNLAYNKLETKKQKQILVFTMVAVTILPSIVNVMNFDSATWWADPKSSDEFQKLMPAWWTGFYPLAYYFTGAYLRDYKPKVKTSTLGIITAISLVAFASFNFYRSLGTTFKSGSYLVWGGVEAYVLSTFIFILISRIKTDNYSPSAKMFLWKISDLALGVYLISFVFDTIYYPILTKAVPVFANRLIWYFVIVPAVFLSSILASYLINLLAKYIIIGWKKLVQFVKDEKAKDNKDKWLLITFSGLMLLTLGFSLWKCFYGLGGNDEAFYLTIPQRLLKGDALFADEWHLSQLSGILMMPFVWLYTTIAGSTTGIMLAARFFYVILHGAVATLVFFKTKKYGYFSVVGSVLYFMFTPFNIMAYSYNTMGLDLVVVAGVLIGTADYSKKLPLIFGGVAFAGAVLCNPYLAFAYVAFIIGVIAHYGLKKTKYNKNVFTTDLFELKTFIWVTVGILIMAVIFLTLLLSRTSIDSIIKNLPYMLADPEHPQSTLMDKFTTYFNCIWEATSVFKYVLMIYIVTLVVMIIDKKRKLHRSLYLIVSVALSLLGLMMFFPEMTSKFYNAIMFPMLFITLTSYILTEKKNRTLFASMFCVGVIYSFALCSSSNQQFYIVPVGLLAGNLAGFMFTAQLVREMIATPDNLDYPKLCKYTSFVMLAFMLVLQAGFQINTKAVHCFWDSYTPELTTQVSDGPAKNIITTKDIAKSYNSLYKDIKKNYSNKTSGRVLCLTSKTWTYLAMDNMSYGTFSAWLSGEDQTALDRLKEFYKLNPKLVPKYIYIPKDSSWPNLSAIVNEAVANGYSYYVKDTFYMLEKK